MNEFEQGRVLDPGAMMQNQNAGGAEQNQDPAAMARLIAVCEQEIQKGIIGQSEVIRQVMLAMLTGGNVLLEGMPGLGKTPAAHKIDVDEKGVISGLF